MSQGDLGDSCWCIVWSFSVGIDFPFPIHALGFRTLGRILNFTPTCGLSTPRFSGVASHCHSVLTRIRRLVTLERILKSSRNHVLSVPGIWTPWAFLLLPIWKSIPCNLLYDDQIRICSVFNLAILWPHVQHYALQIRSKLRKSWNLNFAILNSMEA